MHAARGPIKVHAINEINTLFYQFLWNGKGDKIKRKIMINDYCEGGLKMIDFVSFNKSLKTTWIKKILGFHERKMESFYRPSFEKSRMQKRIYW